MTVPSVTGAPGTPIQQAIVHALGVYAAWCQRLNPAEADVLRDVIAARLAADYLADRGDLDLSIRIDSLSRGDEENAA